MLKISGPTVNATNLELVDLATIKTYTQQQSTENDSILQALLDNTHRQLYSVLGNRMILRVAGTPWVYLLSGGMDGLQLPQWPMITGTASFDIGYIQDSSNTWQSFELLADNSWYANAEYGIIYLTSGGFWPLGYRNIKATFEAGYSTCPEDLRDAICQWVAVKFQRYSTKRWDWATVTKELETISFRESEIPREAWWTIRSYEKVGSGIG